MVLEVGELEAVSPLLIPGLERVEMDLNFRQEDSMEENESEEQPQHVYLTMCRQEGDLRDVDLKGFIRNLIAIGRDYGIHLESITAQSSDFQIGSHDSKMFEALWDSITSTKS